MLDLDTPSARFARGGWQLAGSVHKSDAGPVWPVVSYGVISEKSESIEDDSAMGTVVSSSFGTGVAAEAKGGGAVASAEASVSRTQTTETESSRSRAAESAQSRSQENTCTLQCAVPSYVTPNKKLEVNNGVGSGCRTGSRDALVYIWRWQEATVGDGFSATVGSCHAQCTCTPEPPKCALGGCSDEFCEGPCIDEPEVPDEAPLTTAPAQCRFPSNPSDDAVYDTACNQYCKSGIRIMYQNRAAGTTFQVDVRNYYVTIPFGCALRIYGDDFLHDYNDYLHDFLVYERPSCPAFYQLRTARVFGYDPSRDARVLHMDHRSKVAGDNQNVCNGQLLEPPFRLAQRPPHTQDWSAMSVLSGASMTAYSQPTFLGQSFALGPGVYQDVEWESIEVRCPAEPSCPAPRCPTRLPALAASHCDHMATCALCEVASTRPQRATVCSPRPSPQVGRSQLGVAHGRAHRLRRCVLHTLCPSLPPPPRSTSASGRSLHPSASVTVPPKGTRHTHARVQVHGSSDPSALSLKAKWVLAGSVDRTNADPEWPTVAFGTSFDGATTKEEAESYSASVEAAAEAEVTAGVGFEAPGFEAESTRSVSFSSSSEVSRSSSRAFASTIANSRSSITECTLSCPVPSQVQPDDASAQIEVNQGVGTNCIAPGNKVFIWRWAGTATTTTLSKDGESHMGINTCHTQCTCTEAAPACPFSDCEDEFCTKCKSTDLTLFTSPSSVPYRGPTWRTPFKGTEIDVVDVPPEWTLSFDFRPNAQRRIGEGGRGGEAANVIFVGDTSQKRTPAVFYRYELLYFHYMYNSAVPLRGFNGKSSSGNGLKLREHYVTRVVFQMRRKEDSWVGDATKPYILSAFYNGTEVGSLETQLAPPIASNGAYRAPFYVSAPSSFSNSQWLVPDAQVRNVAFEFVQ